MRLTPQKYANLTYGYNVGEDGECVYSASSKWCQTDIQHEMNSEISEENSRYHIRVHLNDEWGTCAIAETSFLLAPSQVAPGELLKPLEKWCLTSRVSSQLDKSSKILRNGALQLELS